MKKFRITKRTSLNPEVSKLTKLPRKNRIQVLTDPRIIGERSRSLSRSKFRDINYTLSPFRPNVLWRINIWPIVAAPFVKINLGRLRIYFLTVRFRSSSNLLFLTKTTEKR